MRVPLDDDDPVGPFLSFGGLESGLESIEGGKSNVASSDDDDVFERSGSGGGHRARWWRNRKESREAEEGWTKNDDGEVSDEEGNRTKSEPE